MHEIGIVEEIWRYPISSVGGESLASAEIGREGISFDRQWALVDAETGKPAAPETDARWRPALFLNARVRGGVTEIGFADGQWLDAGTADVGARLLEHFGFSVELGNMALALKVKIRASQQRTGIHPAQSTS